MNLGTLGFAIRVIVMLLVVLFVVLGVSGKVRKWLKRILKGETITQDTSSYIKILVEAEAGDVLILADTWYPGWKCYANGKRVEGFNADGFRGYLIPETGHYEIEWKYQPDSLRIGLFISIISFIIFLCLITREKFMLKKATSRQ